MFAAHIVGSALGGATIGLVLGWLGALGGEWMSGGSRLIALCCAALLGVAIDRVWDYRALRWTPRQVPERWRYRYRAPVWSFGYGVQLGAGFTTIVASSVTWVGFLAAFVCGSPAGGGVIGFTFGVVRACTLLPARRAIDAPSLSAVMRAHAYAAAPVAGRLAAIYTAFSVLALAGALRIA
jgi:hypothetical protein